MPRQRNNEYCAAVCILHNTVFLFPYLRKNINKLPYNFILQSVGVGVGLCVCVCAHVCMRARTCVSLLGRTFFPNWRSRLSWFEKMRLNFFFPILAFCITSCMGEITGGQVIFKFTPTLTPALMTLSQRSSRLIDWTEETD